MNKLKNIIAIEKISLKIKESIKVIFYCFQISWEASKINTLLRAFFEATMPLLEVISVFLGKAILDSFTREDSGKYTIYLGKIQIPFFLIILLGIFIIRVVRSAIERFSLHIKMLHSEMIIRSLSVKIIKFSTDIDLECYDDTDYYDKLQMAMRNIDGISRIFDGVISLFGTLISIITVFIVIWSKNPIYILLLAVTLIPYVLMSMNYTKMLYELSFGQMTLEREKYYFQGITLDKQYAQSIRLFALGEFIKEKFNKLWEITYNKRKKLLNKKTAAMSLILCIPEIIILWISIDIGFQIIKNKATIGDYALYTGMISQLMMNLLALSHFLVDAYDSKLQIINLYKVLNYKNKIKNGNKVLYDINTIEFKNVSFSYPKSDIKVLDNVSFFIKEHSKTALIGINGSGKSTLIKLLLRMYDPDDGEIRINGINIKEYDIKTMRENFSVYFQEMENYSMSILENIVIGDLGKDSDDKKEIFMALNKSGGADILSKIKNNLDCSLTRIFDVNGIELSVGQHQKLALARCFYRRHTALILDEPSASLDSKTENLIFEQLEKEMEDKLTILISHRLSNIKFADQIIVLQNGKVIEIGTHNALMQKKGLYAELYSYQSEKYNTESDKNEPST